MAMKKKKLISKSDFIPVCEPVIGKQEKKYIIDCLDTNWISSQGKYVDKFAVNFAKFCDVKYGVLTTSGTTALHLALVALGIGQGDEVIIPAFTMIATAFAVVYTGAKLVLVDSEPETGNIDITKIEEKITPKTKAIIPVHIYGHPCNMDSIMKLVKKYKLWIVEDAAEAHGGQYKGRMIGGIGDIGCFSFYANKIITMGEGGIAVTNNEKVFQKLKLFCDLAHSPEKRFAHIEIGYNYRLTNLQAAIGLAQLEKIGEFVKARRKNAEIYQQHLKNIKGLQLPQEKEWAKNVYWMYGILLEKSFPVSRDELMAILAKNGIGTRAFFIPMHLQPVFIKMGLFKGEKYPVAENWGENGLYLPSGSGLTSKQIIYISEKIKKIAQN